MGYVEKEKCLRVVISQLVQTLIVWDGKMSFLHRGHPSRLHATRRSRHLSFACSHLQMQRVWCLYITGVGWGGGGGRHLAVMLLQRRIRRHKTATKEVPPHQSPNVPPGTSLKTTTPTGIHSARPASNVCMWHRLERGGLPFTLWGGGRINSVNPNDNMQERIEFLWPGCVLEYRTQPGRTIRGLLDGSFS